jgi:hypothetical protein
MCVTSSFKFVGLQLVQMCHFQPKLWILICYFLKWNGIQNFESIWYFGWHGTLMN